MSNVSIYEKNWTDLVFEDRNKSYGAYQLRQENPRTTLFAFFCGSLLILSLIGGFLLFSSFGNKIDVKPLFEEDPIITLTQFNLPKKNLPEKQKAVVPIKKEEPTKKIDKKDLTNVTIVKPEDIPDNIKTNKEAKENPTDTKTEGTTTTGTTTGYVESGTATTGTKSEGTSITSGIIKTNELDRLPEYPGGISKFYQYVGNTIEKPEVDESISSVSVIMSFVIERDGSMTDIKVLRSSDKNLERESIRVLKALKVKWSPGYKDGEKVRTLYTLPIKVAL